MSSCTHLWRSLETLTDIEKETTSSTAYNDSSLRIGVLEYCAICGTVRVNLDSEEIINTSWVEVEHRLPKEDVEVLVCTFKHEIKIGAYTEYTDEDFGGNQYYFKDWHDTQKDEPFEPNEILCWCELPKPPNFAEGDNYDL